MTRDELLQKLRDNKGRLEQKYPLKSLALFGSYSRNEQTAESDVDLLVEFNEPVGIEFIDLLLEIEAILDKPVDLVTKKSVRPRLKAYIEKDMIYV
jgi:predicted nucleotidyltransferase